MMGLLFGRFKKLTVSIEPDEPEDTHKCAIATGASAVYERLPVGNRRCLKVLTYNIWFDERTPQQARMQGFSQVVISSGLPDVIMLQEVTGRLLCILQALPWWCDYHCSPIPHDLPYFTALLLRKDSVSPEPSTWFEHRFENSMMGRSILGTRCSWAGLPLMLATSHLESPMGPHRTNTARRAAQLKEALDVLGGNSACGEVLYGGDMNWIQEDGPCEVAGGWLDAWQALHPDQEGLTWDPATNEMIEEPFKGGRLDRLFCRLKGLQLQSIRLVGTEPLQGVTCKGYSGHERPVLVSDHYGLLAELIKAG